jgi:hypothetical protein
MACRLVAIATMSGVVATMKKRRTGSSGVLGLKKQPEPWLKLLRHRRSRVAVKDIREFFGVLTSEIGIFVTTGASTPQTVSAASAISVQADVPLDSQKPASPVDKPGTPTLPATCLRCPQSPDLPVTSPSPFRRQILRVTTATNRPLFSIAPSGG